jgi:hypothetical protein
MLKIKFYILIILISSCQNIFGQEKEIIIPFKLTEFNNISLLAVLNDKDTISLMFHTAANSVTLIEDATKKIKSLNFNNNTEGVKSWGGETNSSRLSENNILQIGEIKFKGISIWENKYSGPQTDGKFGLDLFKDKVLKLDFERSILIIASRLPNEIRKYQKLKLVFEDEMMFLEASFKINNVIKKNSFLIHSGYSGDLLFDDKFAGDNQMSENLKITGEKELKDSYGNVLKTMKAIIPYLEIGNIKLSDVPVGFFSGAIGRQKMSVMGGDILKRFNIIIDSKREYIYLKPNKLINMEYTKKS